MDEREPYQDAFTENASKLPGPERDRIEQQKRYDAGVDSQEADRAMEEDRFGVNEPKKRAE